jgi:hypothetical protein
MKRITGGGLALSVVVALVCLMSPAMAAQFEKPPSFNAAKVFGAAVQGVNYTIQSPVQSDGFLRAYVLTTPYGNYAVHGDHMLLLRMRELAALDILERTSSSEEFAQAAVKAGLSPVVYAGQLVTNPVGTVGNTISGVGEMFGRISSGLSNKGAGNEKGLASVTGVSKQKRLIAHQVGVDPYTDFKPLADKLNQLAQASAIGGLAVSTVFMAIPGGAGMVVSSTSTAGNVSAMVRDQTAAQLMDRNRSTLTGLGIAKDLQEELLHNRFYTPLDLTAMVEALAAMPDVRGLDIYVERAINANTRDVAYFVRRRAELLADYQRQTGNLAAFIDLKGFPLNVTRGNGVMSLFPIDVLSWTKTTSDLIQAIDAARKDLGYTGPVEVQITGRATSLAKKQLKSLGWSVVEMVGS